MVRIKRVDLFLVICMDILISMIAGELFYDSYAMSIILIWPLGAVLLHEYKKIKNRRGEKRFTYQFEEMLECLASALQAGYSLENAVFEAKKQLEFMYGSNVAIVREVDILWRGIKMNIPIEKLFGDMADKVGVNVVSDYAQVLTVAKRYGGNLIEITKQNIEIMRERRMVHDEIDTMITGKKCESFVMNLMPITILLYLKLTSFSMIQPLYIGIIGRTLMTVLLCGYILTIILSAHITTFDEGDSNVKKKKFKPVKGNIIAIVNMFIKVLACKRINVINDKVSALYPEINTEIVMQRFWAEVLRNIFAGVIAGGMILVTGLIYYKDKICVFCILAVVVICGIPYMLFAKINKAAIIRMQQIDLDYPEIVDKLILYLGAGLSLKGCFKRMAQEYEAKKKSAGRYRYVYEEICRLIRCLDNGVTEVGAYERFGKRCGNIQYIRLATMLSQNLKKGNANMLDKLRMTAIDAFEKRKMITKKLGEKASSKLLLPMMLQFTIILIIIMYPALCMSR